MKSRKKVYNMTLLSDQDLALPFLTAKRLAELWNSYWKDEDSHKWLRFGQYVYNVSGYETDVSYQINDAQLAYDNILTCITK